MIDFYTILNNQQVLMQLWTHHEQLIARRKY